MNQFGLPFDWPTEEDTSDFIVTSANELAVRHLEAWGSWPVRACLLVGPRKSGKSLLGRIFCARSKGQLLDDADQRPEQDVFHAWNRAQETRIPLLMIAEMAPPEWAIRLPDLRSRLQATPVARIGLPDAALAEALLIKLLAKRGLAMLPEMAAFVAERIERSFIAVQRAADAIDAASLSQKRAISLPLVRQALEQASLIDRAGRRREHSAHAADNG
ncbi:MAG: hypothetical protein RJB22_2216 [Pseudomonadota bacterium]|jgi:chromosomal replication initiation ATPase DnaA